MLFKNLNLILCGFLFTVSVNIAYGHPHDIRQLIASWTEMDKTDNCSEFIELDAFEIENKETFFAEKITEEISHLPLKELSKFSYKQLNQSVRKEILGNLFADENHIPSFCKAFPLSVKKLAEVNLDDLENREKLEKKAKTICKNQVTQLLGGIFYADPIAYSFAYLTKEDQEIKGEYKLYLASLVKPGSYLKYTFKL